MASPSDEEPWQPGLPWDHPVMKAMGVMIAFADSRGTGMLALAIDDVELNEVRMGSWELLLRRTEEAT